MSTSMVWLQVYYTVDRIGDGKGKDWKGGVGYVTREMVAKHIPPPGDDNLILVCGPGPMYKAISGEKKSPKDQGKLSDISGDQSMVSFHACPCVTNPNKPCQDIYTETDIQWRPLVSGQAKLCPDVQVS